MSGQLDFSMITLQSRKSEKKSAGLKQKVPISMMAQTSFPNKIIECESDNDTTIEVDLITKKMRF